MSIPLDVFGSRRQQGETSNPLTDVKPENWLMAAVEMHRMGRFEDLRNEHAAKVPSALVGQRSKFK